MNPYAALAVSDLVAERPATAARALGVLVDHDVIEQLSAGGVRRVHLDDAAQAMAVWAAEVDTPGPPIPIPCWPLEERPAMPDVPEPRTTPPTSLPDLAPERTPSGRYRTVFNARPSRGRARVLEHQVLRASWPPLLCRLGWHWWASRSVCSERPADRPTGAAARTICTLVSRCGRAGCDVVRHEQNVAAPGRPGRWQP